MADPLPPRIEPQILPPEADPFAAFRAPQPQPVTDPARGRPAATAHAAQGAPVDAPMTDASALLGADPVLEAMKYEPPPDAAPAAPSGPGPADVRMDQGQQLADVTGTREFEMLGERRPGRVVENQQKNLLEDFGAAYYGDAGGGLPTIEQVAAEIGFNTTPPAPFDPDAAASTFEPPMRLESETRDEYTQRTRALAQQHIKIAELEHAALETDYFASMGELQQIYDEEIKARSRDMSLIAEEGGPNIFEAQTAGHTWRTEAEQTQLNTAATRLEQTALEMQDATSAIRQQEEARQSRVEAEFQAAQTVQDTLRAARQRLEAQPDPDAGRYFKSMTGGQQFLALLGAAFTGWNGSQMIPQMMLQLASQDLEGQKATIAKRQAEVGAAATELEGQMSIYQHILAQVKDERTADIMMLSLQMEDAERMLQSEMARTTVQVHAAGMYQIMVGIKEQQNKLFYELQARIKAMPDKIVVGGGYKYNKDQRSVMAHDLKARSTEGVQQIGGAIEMPWEAQKKAAEMQHDFDLEAAKQSYKAAAKKVEEGVSAEQQIINEINALERDFGGDIPQSGASAVAAAIPGTDTRERAKEYATKRSLLVGMVAHMLNPDGKISDADWRIAERMVGEGDLLDSDVKSRHQALKATAQRRINQGQTTPAGPLKTLEIVDEE